MSKANSVNGPQGRIHVDDGGGFPGLTPGGHVTNSCETLWSETKALSPAHRNELAEFMIGRWKAWADGTGV